MIIAIICILTNLTGKCYELVFAYTALITIKLPCFLYIYCAFDSVVCVCLLFCFFPYWMFAFAHLFLRPFYIMRTWILIYEMLAVSCTSEKWDFGQMSSAWPPNTFSSVQFSRSVVSNYLRPHESQHARPPGPSPTPRVYSNSCPSSRWCHPAISSSVIPFSSCPRSLPASGSFPMSQFFASGGQSSGVSASVLVLPMNTQDWSPSGWTGWISLQSKGLSRVFSNTTVQKHQFFGAQLSSQSNSHIHTWPLGKP